MRIYAPAQAVTKSRIFISDSRQVHHLADVCRLKAGDALVVFDGISSEYECVIEQISRDRADLSILKARKTVQPKASGITLACAIPKKAKMDYIVQKVTELGVERIIPLHTERTVVELKEDSAANKLRRWQAIAMEASKQCGRVKLPVIEPVSEFKDVAARIQDFDLAIMPHLGIDNIALSDAVRNSQAARIIVFIGPEGDFSESEVMLAKAKGCIGVSLGNLVLKIDTAAIAVVSFLRLRKAR